MANKFDLPTNKFNTPEVDTPFASTNFGVALNTVLGLPKALKDTAKTIFRGITRNIGSAGVTVADKLGADDEFTPEGKVFKAIFGDEPIQTVERRVADAEIAVKSSPTAQKLGIDKFALPLAFGAIIGDTALDLTPLIGSKTAVKALVRETTSEGVMKILIKSGIPADVAKEYAPKLARASTKREVIETVGLLKGSVGIKLLEDATKPFFKPIGKILRRETPIQQKITSFLHPPEERTPVGGMHLGKETLNLYSQPQGGIGLDPFGFAGGLRRVGKQVSKKITESVGQKISKGVEEFTDTLRGTKGMTADDIMKKYPDIQLKRDVPAKDIYGNKVELPKGLALRPYEMKGNKVLLQDGETYIVTKNQFQNIKGQSISGETKPFAPELEGLEETYKGLRGDETVEQAREIAQDTRYSQYQLPEGKNYKEILIKAPTKGILTNAEIKRLDFLENSLGKNLTAQQKSDYEFLKQTVEQGRQKQFRTGHWDEPNVLSHLRMNERTYKGKKVSFMEELQSDWMRALRDEAKEKFTVNGVVDTEKANQYVRDALSGKVKSKTPVNQMLKNWETPSVKRALKEAVENDSDYFAWINGKQTSARYNLATYVKDVKWGGSDLFDVTPGTIKTIKLNPRDAGRFEFGIDKNGVIKSIEDGTPLDMKGKKLDEVLGKGLADKIMGKEKGTLSGEGLKFGGEWADNLYDKQVKNIVEDLTGAKIEKLDMGLPIENARKKSRFIDPRNTYETREGILPEELGNKYKIGYELQKDAYDGSSHELYIITDILGDGKFKAVPKSHIDSVINDKRFATNKTIPEAIAYLKKVAPSGMKPFDISQKLTTQQGIKLTPEIKAKIRGEAPKIKTSGEMFESSLEPLAKVDDAVSKLIKAVKEAGTPRQELETAFTAERARRAGAIGGIFKGGEGQKGYYQSLSKLKGELAEKKTFELVKLDIEDVDDLFNIAQKHPHLDVFEKVTVQNSLNKLLNGSLPTKGELGFLEDVYGRELVAEILKKRKFTAKLGDAITEAMNVPRTLITSFDMSAPLRQGLFFTTKPKAFASATKEMFRQVFSPKNFKQWLDDVPNHPLYSQMKAGKLYLADPDSLARGLSGKEEAFMSNLAGKIPVIGAMVRASERSFVGFLNKLRVDVFTQLVTKFGKEKKLTVKDLKSIAEFVNVGTGRGKLGALEKSAQALNTAFFSPRLISARFSLFNPVWYAKQTPQVRKEAIKNFAQFIATGTTILGLVNAIGGDNVDVEVDPRSTDFGKIRVGNTRWDMWGGFQQWVRVFSQIVSGSKKTTSGDVVLLDKDKFPFDTRLTIGTRFARGKLAPIPALTLELLDGQKLFGGDIELKGEVAEKTIPLYLQDLYEGVQDRGSEGIFSVGVPAFFGVGVQTYKSKKGNKYSL